MINKYYRADIDGLRGISVLFVILFHLDISLLNGGFLGVDIFFVISGYLITNLILKDSSENKFNIFDFYERRIRRIAPVLFTVILFSIPLSYYNLSAGVLKDYWQSTLSSSLFLSNFLFALEDNYFDISSKFKPLLHTWTLSVEEQFYIFFPLLLIPIYKINKKIFFYFLLILTCLSLYFFFVNPKIYLSTKSDLINRLFEIGIGNYYVSFSRFWEIFFGCIISIIFFKKYKSSNIISIISFLSILFIIIFYNENFIGRKISTLLIIIFTSLLVIFCNNTHIFKLLSNKILVKVGLMSYSLYLVHYLVISYSYVIFAKLNLYLILSNIILIFLISFLIHIFIEKPFRNRNFLNQKKIYSLFFIITLFLILISIIGLTKVFQKHHNDYLKKNIDEKYFPLLIDIKKEGNYVNNKIEHIKKNNIFKSNLENILFLGDSQNWDWVRTLYDTNLKNKYNIVFYDIRTNCYPYIEKEKSIFYDNNCVYLINQIKNFLGENTVKLTIINHLFKNTQEIHNVQPLIDYLKKNRSEIILVGNAEFVNMGIISNAKAKSLSNTKNIEHNFTKNEYIIKSRSILNEHTENFAKKNGINFIDEYDYFCNLENCQFFSKDFKPFFYDNTHLTKYGEDFLKNKLKIFLKKNNIIF